MTEQKVKKGSVVAFSEDQNPAWFDVVKVDGKSITVRQVGEAPNGEPYAEDESDISLVRQVKD